MHIEILVYSGLIGGMLGLAAMIAWSMFRAKTFPKLKLKKDTRTTVGNPMTTYLTLVMTAIILFATAIWGLAV